MTSWDGLTIQDALKNCTIVNHERMTDNGPLLCFYLVLNNHLISLGTDANLADSLQFALRRNAKYWDERMSKMPSDMSFLDTNPIMEDMLRIYGSLKPWLWYKRWASKVGHWFIRIGIKLGGSYD